MSVMRTRWAAIGAAVAVTLGAGGIGLVSATNPSGAAALVPITPCRITDTRPATQVGPKASPVSPNETYTIAAYGANGGCTIPASATGLSMNVTAVNATANTFLTFWGAGTRPTAANLNPRAGGPPTPNSVTTPLGGSGSFNVYNKAGNVDIIIDIVGYYTDHTHDDRYYTKGQSNDRYAPRQTVVVVDPLDFVLLGTNWTQGGDVVSRGGGGASSCIQAPLELPVGASLESVTLAYLTFGATVDVVIGSYRRVAGPFDVDFLVSGPETVPSVGEFTLGEAAIPIDDNGPIVTDRSYYLEVCSGATFWLSAVEITHS